MKIVVSAQGVAWDAPIDPRLGRAPHLVLVDTETGELTGLDNSGAIEAAQGAGVLAAATVCRCGAEAIITGHCGPKAFDALRTGRVRVFTGAEGTVAAALQRFQAGELPETVADDVAGHWV
jgi:predicted Fe-Mo cluster-binding NifX family protein